MRTDVVTGQQLAELNQTLAVRYPWRKDCKHVTVTGMTMIGALDGTSTKHNSNHRRIVDQFRGFNRGVGATLT